MNPVRYEAKYFGHKCHIDQNEKLIHYGVTHVVARDGFSGKIVSSLTLPIKNNWQSMIKYSGITIDKTQ